MSYSNLTDSNLTQGIKNEHVLPDHITITIMMLVSNQALGCSPRVSVSCSYNYTQFSSLLYFFTHMINICGIKYILHILNMCMHMHKLSSSANRDFSSPLAWVSSWHFLQYLFRWVVSARWVSLSILDYIGLDKTK